MIEARDRSLKPGVLAVVLLAAASLFAGIFTLPILDRDEPRFGHAALEMIRRGDFVVPWFNDLPRLAKPPLSYWWMIANVKLFGADEWSVRLHSAIAACLVAVVLANFGRRLTGRWQPGLLAAGAWLTALQTCMQGRVCTADMVLVLFVTLSMRALWELVLPGQPRIKGWWCVFWLSMAGGFLAKGPIAWAVPLLAGLLLAWRCRKDEGAVRRPSHLIAGILLCLALCAAWGVPALIATHGRFFTEGVGHDIVERGTTSLNGRLYLPGVFYLLTIPISLLPWTPLLPAALRRFRETSLEARFLSVWLLAPLVIFSFYATQLPHYVLPGLPAFFLLVFCRPATAKPHLLWTILTTALPIIAAVLVIGPALKMPQLPEFGDPRMALFYLSAFLFCLGIASALAGRNRPVAAMVLVALAGFLTLPGGQVFSRLNPTEQVVKLIDPLTTVTPIGIAYTEPSLVWCTDRIWRLGGTWQDVGDAAAWRVVLLKSWDAGPKNYAAMMKGQLPDTPSRDFTGKLIKEGQAGELARAHIVHAWNLATSNWVELAVIPPAESGTALN
ncbi:MAG: glycosyltransferase family 39 protein [Luteolibacter sp.]